VRFCERNHAARLERNDVDVHVVTHVAGIDETRRHPAAFGARHRNRLDVLLVRDERFGKRHAIDGFIVLANPVKTRRILMTIAQLPVRAGRNERIPACLQNMQGALQSQFDLAFDDEQHAFGIRVLFGFFAAAARRHFHDVLRERLGESGKRTREHPETRLVPERQMTRDDIAHHALGNDGIRFSEHRAIGEQLGLRWMTAVRRVVRVA
jgi:hypothetical protein